MSADHLLKLEPDRMLAFYRKRAGLEPTLRFQAAGAMKPQAFLASAWFSLTGRDQPGEGLAHKWYDWALMKINLELSLLESVSASDCRRLRLALALLLWPAPIVTPSVAQEPTGAPSAAQHRQEGVRYLQNREPQKALEHFRAAARIEPQDAESRFFIGAILCDSGQPEAAIPELQKAVELNRKLHLSHYYLALAFDRAG